MMNIKYITIEDMITKLQSLRGETKLKFNEDFCNFYNELKYRRQSGNFHFQEVAFGKNAQDVAMIMH